MGTVASTLAIVMTRRVKASSSGSLVTTEHKPVAIASPTTCPQKLDEAVDSKVGDHWGWSRWVSLELRSQICVAEVPVIDRTQEVSKVQC